MPIPDDAAEQFDAETEAKLLSIGINVGEFANGFRAADAFIVAHRLAHCGKRVFPVRRNKRPHIRGFQNAATSDGKQILQWQRQFPGCDWAILTGRANGLVVLDVDGERGAADLQNLELKLGKLPETAICNSGRVGGGFHVWLEPPAGTDDLRNQQPLSGTKVDVRGWHGYVVIAGSRHKSGNRYGWKYGCAPDECGIAECPPDWWAWLPKKEDAARPRAKAPRPSPHTRASAVQHDTASLLIGDGPGFGGFQNPIYRNAIYYFFKAGGDASAKIIVETLQELIVAAPKDQGRDVSRYLSGDDLPRIVERARQFVIQVKEKEIEQY